MRRWLVRRLLSALAALFALSVVVFVLIRLVPGEGGVYQGTLPMTPHARLVVTLQSHDWTLPTTVVAGGASVVRLAATMDRRG